MLFKTITQTVGSVVQIEYQLQTAVLYLIAVGGGGGGSVV